MENKLVPHEWLSLTVIIGVLISLGTIYFLNREEIPIEAFKRNIPFIEVTVEGAVEEQTVVHLKKGAKLKDLLEQVKLFPEADVSSLKPNSTLRHGQVVKIPSTLITVFVEGEVMESKQIILPRDSRLEDIIPLVALTEAADGRFLKKKRKLKDGEKIHVPPKKAAAA